MKKIARIFPQLEIPDYVGLKEFIGNEIVRKAVKKQNSKLKEYLINNLSQLGYSFSSDDEFHFFLSQRVHRITFEDQPNYYEFYIDFVDYDNKGSLFGIYSDKIQIQSSEDGFTVTATIG